MSDTIGSVNDIKSQYTGGITTSTAIQGKDASSMGMDEFFNLLVAQMTNQDMMNPSNDTEFVSQMAQFTSLQGMKTIQEYQLSSYAASYVGKEVTVAQVNETTGKIDRISGVVESVSFYDGSPKVVVDGKAYDLHTVMEVNVAGAGSGAANPITTASKYIGKYVSVKDTDIDGNSIEVSGIVESVTSKDGKGYVYLNGKAYSVEDITTYWDEAPDAAKYIGKNVIIETVDEDNNDVTVRGIVERITQLDGLDYVVVNGKRYLASLVKDYQDEAYLNIDETTTEDVLNAGMDTDE